VKYGEGECVEAVSGSNVVVESRTIPELVGMVHHGEFVIPDFQRDVVWRTAQVAALWDSVYRGFPIGSMLYWITGERMAALRAIGGFDLSDSQLADQRFGALRYVLDGQQRLTAFFIAMAGGKKRVKSDLEVDYSLYFDPTADEIASSRARTGASDQDGARAYSTRYFLFESERAARTAELKRAGVSSKLLVRVKNADSVSDAVRQALALETGYTERVSQNLARFQRTLQEYRVPLVCVSNASPADVSQIFQRVNQSGTELTVFDIAVARAFRTGESEVGPEFSLRANVERIKRALKPQSRDWAEIDNLALLRMIAYCLRVLQNRGELEKSPRVSAEHADLPSIGAHDLSRVWERVEDAIARAIGFFLSQGIYKPDLLAADYLPLPVCAHLLDHPYAPQATEWTQISRWFWRHAFDRQSIKDQGSADRATRDVFDHLRAGTPVGLSPLTLNVNDLVLARNPKSALYKAAWGLFSYLGPRDFDSGRFVTVDPHDRWKRRPIRPSRHHIYPIAFLERLGQAAGETLDAQSVMNVAVVTTQTNMEMEDTSPIVYYQTFQKRRDIEQVMASHLIPTDYFKRDQVFPDEYRAFLAERARRVMDTLRVEFDLTISEK
jgi:hypothetical protein